MSNIRTAKKKKGGNRIDRRSAKKKKGGDISGKRTNKKKRIIQTGGNEDIRAIVLSLLTQRYVPFLPTTHVLNDQNLVRDYLSAVDALHLLRIIGENDKFINSNSINGIIEDIDSYSMNMLKQMGNIVHLPVFKPMLQNFRVNCAKMSTSGIASMKKLHSYILDCDDSMSNKHVDWFDVVLGLKKFDDQFEVLVIQEIKDKKIIMDSDKILYALKQVREDKDVREIFKKRIMNCAYKPQSIWNQFTGSVSWVSYNECAQCPGPDCVLYLDENYKSFLRMRHKVLTVDKIKMLIYVDIRAHLLSKYVSLEALRISGDRKKYVTSLLNKVYKEDMKIKNIGDVLRTPFQMLTGLFTGGAETDLPKPVADPVADPAIDSASFTPGPEPSPTTEPSPSADPAIDSATFTPGLEPTPAANPAIDSATFTPTTEPSPTSVSASEPISELNTDPATFTPTTEPSAEPKSLDPTQSTEQQNPTVNNDEVKLEDMSSANPQQFTDTDTYTRETTDVENISEETPPSSNKIFYITYNGGVKDEKELDDASYEVIDAFALATGIQNKDRLVIHRTRTGPISVCFELEVTKAYEFLDEVSMDDIKKNIEKAILENSFEDSMKIKTLESLKDIYYEGFSKGEFSTKDIKHKRAIVSVKLQYPEKDEDRGMFESSVTKILADALGEDIDSRRLHLESVEELMEDKERVVVQFLVMDGFMGTKSSYDIVREFLSKKDDSEFLEKHELKNIQELEGCLVFDTDYSRPYESKYETLKTTGLKTMGDMIDTNRVQNYGCDDTVESIKNNVIKSTNSLSKQCEDPINKALGITSPQMRT